MILRKSNLKFCQIYSNLVRSGLDRREESAGRYSRCENWSKMWNTVFSQDTLFPRKSNLAIYFFYGIRFQILFSWKRGLSGGKSYSIYFTYFRFKPLTVFLVFSQQLTNFKYEGSTRKKGNVNFNEFWILHFSSCVMLLCMLIITGYVVLIWMKISCSSMVITRNSGVQCTFHFSRSNLTHYILLHITKKS